MTNKAAIAAREAGQGRASLPQRSEEDRKKHYLRRLSALEQERQSWDGHWQDLARHFLPRRSRFLNKGDRTNDGEKQNKELVDSTGILSVRTLSSGMQSGLTSPARPWFRLSLQDEGAAGAGDAKNWLHDTQMRMANAFARSNFYDQIHMLYHELGVFGTACMVIEEDPISVIRCRTLTAGEFCMFTDAAGRADTLYRRLRMTARQMADAWPDTVPERVRRMAEQDNGQWLEVLHAVEPNPDHAPDRRDGKSRPFISVYMLLDGQREILEDSGYYEFPALCPRWDATGSDIYGRSPAMDALADTRMLQRMRRDGLESLAREVRPPLGMAASTNGVMPDITPGAVTVFSPLAQGQNNIWPLYQVKANLQGLEGTIAGYQNQIRRIFFNDLFAMLSDISRQMTATEVAERNAEKMLLLGPVLDRLRSELFQPLIERVYGIMERHGLIAFPPDSLQGQEIKVEFVSILAQAQKAAGISSVQQAAGFVGQMAQMNPAALDKLDTDEAVDQVAEMLGVPPRLIRGGEEVAELRAQREAQQAQMQQMEMMRAGVDMAGGAAKAAKDAGMSEMIARSMGQAPAEGAPGGA